MLTRCTKAYSSSCSQTVNLSPDILSLSVRCSRRSQNQQKPLILEDQSLSKSSMLIRLKGSSLVLVVIGSMLIVICSRFHKRLANNGKITTFTGIPLFDSSCASFLELRKSRLRPSKSTFNAENFICSLSLSISTDFGTFCS